MIETYMVLGAISFAKYFVAGNMVVFASMEMFGKQSRNQIVCHKKWSDIK